MKVYRWANAAMLALAGVSLFGWVMYLAFQHESVVDRGPPATFHASYIDVATAKVGDRVPLRVERDLHYACEEGMVFKFWRRPEDGSYEDFGIRPIFGNMGDHVGSKGFSAMLTIPDLPPGEWCYQPKIQYVCDGVTRTVQQAPACVTIIK